MKLKLLVLFAFVLCSNTNAQTKKWTLKECVEYAVENNIQIKQTALDTLISIENRFKKSFPRKATKYAVQNTQRPCFMSVSENVHPNESNLSTQCNQLYLHHTSSAMIVHAQHGQTP